MVHRARESRINNRVRRKKTGVAPTAQQDVDVRETVVDLPPHPGAPDQTTKQTLEAIEDSDLVGEEIETGIATEEGADIIMDKAAAPVETDEAEQILRKFDRESNTRIWEGVPKIIVRAIMAVFSVYCIGMTLFSTALPEVRLTLFLGCIVIIGFLVYPANKKKVRTNYIPWYDILLMIIGAACFFYFAFNALPIIKLGTRIDEVMIVIGIVGILVVAELCRRSVGLPIIFVLAALLVYAFYFFVVDRGMDLMLALRTVVYRMFYTTNGIIGTPINVCYTYIVLFIIFGAFLERTGIAGFFISFANRIAGWSSGGAAKVAVISSALCGMVSGSSVGNTVTTGSVTIPMMKKTGYKPEFAGAVEAASSTGGQIMPPIMGAAAFLMAEITGIPYASIVVAAILPAVLYFTGIFLMVHFEGKRLGLKGLPKDSIPHFFRLLAKSGYLLIPVVILVICMNYYTAGMSACFAILFALIISLIGRDKRDLLRSVGLPLIPLAVLVVLWQVIKIDTGTAVFVSMVVAVLCSFLTRSAILSPRLVAEGLQGGAGSSIGVAVACAMAGIISGVVSMTALGTTLVAVIVPLAQKSIFLALFCTMLACIVLGMGVPTTANYVIMATITAPILIKMGIPLLAAHMFVFYFGIVADITPPVALAAYAGSAIAHSNPLKTGITATKLAIGAFIIPYIFALNPSLLFIDVESVWALIGIMVTSIIGMAGIAMGMTGHVYAHVPWYMRIMLLAGGIFLIDPSPVSDLIGLLLIGIPFAFQLLQNRKLKATAAE